MNLDVAARYASSIEALQRAVKERVEYPRYVPPGSLMERARDALDARLLRLWDEVQRDARQFPQEERRAAA